MKLSKRQNKLLKIIVDEYTATATPVSSKNLIKKYFKDLSSATIRNEMYFLEKMNLVEKMHTSSGRMPSLEGYRYYEENLLETTDDFDIRHRLRKILNSRSKSIDEVIEMSVNFINEITKLPSIVTHIKSDDRLCRIDLIRLNSNLALVLVVSSSGNIVKKTIKFNDQKQYDDVATCVKVFNDRLIDTKFSEIESKLDSLRKIIKKMVIEYEYIIQEIVNKIFDFNTRCTSDIYGTKNLIKNGEFLDRDKLIKIIDLLENTSIWEQIAYNHQNTGKTTITFGDQIGFEGVSVASTVFNDSEGAKHQISVVGPTRMDYAKVKGLLNIFKEEIEKIGSINNEKNKN
ncbi:heat-inducible transcriptional repressor HrcA [Mycoplasmoides pirum]|uniref:heat-inducible transcriptional repressor HrcA n=1 Tax=Mycoplasmoides pirum TaxID=2122 RepID=UPI00056A1F1E|nr:heat-inducible transcriptional repressor HrcA [Mycoplasmoides pirum]